MRRWKPTTGLPRSWVSQPRRTPRSHRQRPSLSSSSPRRNTSHRGDTGSCRVAAPLWRPRRHAPARYATPLPRRAPPHRVCRPRPASPCRACSAISCRGGWGMKGYKRESLLGF